MSVDEVIAEIRAMKPIERVRVRAALDRLEAVPGADEAADAARRAAVWESLSWGWASAGGKALSEGIDEALYGGGG